MEPTILFLGKNKNYVVAKVNTSDLQKIAAMLEIGDNKLRDIVSTLEYEQTGPELTFKLKNYGGTVPIKHNIIPSTMATIGGIDGNTLVKNLEKFFTKARNYAEQHGISDVLVQNLEIEKVLDHPVYELTGLAQLMVPD